MAHDAFGPMADIDLGGGTFHPLRGVSYEDIPDNEFVPQPGGDRAYPSLRDRFILLHWYDPAAPQNMLFTTIHYVSRVDLTK
eukprot:15439724-Alexandrium_andersonii.AAC.1